MCLPTTKIALSSKLLVSQRLVIGSFIIPPVVVRDSSGYKVVSSHFQFHDVVLAPCLNRKADETIPARAFEAENQVAVLAQLKILKYTVA
jgi:hypothetical protein